VWKKNLEAIPETHKGLLLGGGEESNWFETQGSNSSWQWKTEFGGATLGDIWEIGLQLENMGKGVKLCSTIVNIGWKFRLREGNASPYGGESTVWGGSGTGYQIANARWGMRDESRLRDLEGWKLD